MYLTTLSFENHPPRDSHRLARLAASLIDGGHLFRQAKETLNSEECAGLVLIGFRQDTHIPKTTKAIDLFLCSVQKRLAGRIAAGHRTGAAEFLILLTAGTRYDGDLFEKDLSTFGAELTRYRRLMRSSQGGPGTLPAKISDDVSISGVFLPSRKDQSAITSILMGLRRLFGASNMPAQPKTAEMVAVEQVVAKELLSSVFQPIISLADGTIHGYEALSRLTDPAAFPTPEALFRAAAAHGLAAPLEKLCWQKALREACERQVAGQLFLNICPAVFQNDRFDFTESLIDSVDIPRSRVTIELTERTLIEDYDRLARAISFYRERGYSIAIDDLGSGYAGLKFLAELEPDYVKLSRYLIADIHISATRQALVESLVSFCGRIGACVVAEGIEQMEELSYLASIGVTYGQGYLLARPTTDPVARINRFLCG